MLSLPREDQRLSCLTALFPFRHRKERPQNTMPSKQYLTIYSPTPTTISYTVSTRPTNPTKRARLFTAFKHLVRIAIVGLVVTVIITKLQLQPQLHIWTADQAINHQQQNSSPGTGNSTSTLAGSLRGSLWHGDNLLRGSPGLSTVRLWAEGYSWSVILALGTVLVLLCLRSDYTGKFGHTILTTHRPTSHDLLGRSGSWQREQYRIRKIADISSIICASRGNLASHHLARSADHHIPYILQSCRSNILNSVLPANLP